MERLNVEQGGGRATCDRTGQTFTLTVRKGVEVYVNGLLRCSITFGKDETEVVLHGDGGPVSWITTAEEVEE
jgi:hypothetical protein